MDYRFEIIATDEDMVQVNVEVGMKRGPYECVGTLRMQTDEWAELRSAILLGKGQDMGVEILEAE